MSLTTASPSHPTAVSLRACAKTYPGGTRVLEPLDLDIAAGETEIGRAHV